MRKLLLFILAGLILLHGAYSSFAATTTYRLFPVDYDFDEDSSYNELYDYTSMGDIVDAAETEGETAIVIQLMANYELGDDDGYGDYITLDDSNIDSLTSIILNGGGYKITAPTEMRHLVMNASGLTLTLDNLTLTGYTGGNSGGIELTAGTLIANSVTFSGLGLDYEAGGALYIDNSATATLTSCTFMGNTATDGGAIYTSGTATLSSITFGNGTSLGRNSATNGGAIYIAADSTVNLGGSTLNTNSADLGGGIYSAGTLTLSSGNTFTGNTATNGGAIYLPANATLTISGTDTQTFSANIATSSGGGLYAAQSSILNWSAPVVFNNRNRAVNGGGMYIHAGSQVSRIASTVDFSENEADYGGGLYVGINNSSTLTLNSGTGWTFSGNKANYDGGGIYTVAADVEISGLEITDENVADNAGGFVYSGGEVKISGATISNQRANYGGAIYASNGATISGSTFEGNRAAMSATEYLGGGAIFVEGELTITAGTNFTDNRVTSTTGKQGGGAIFVSGDAEITGATFTDNLYTNNNSNQEGGGGAIYLRGRLTLVDSTFSGNEVKGPTGGGAGCGGAIYADSSTLTTSNSYFEDNRADCNGGAIYVGGNSTTTLRYTTFSANSTANGNGGAIYAQGVLDMGTYDDRHNMSSNVGANYFTENISARNGGAVCFNSYRRNGQGQLNVSYTMFTNNSTLNGQGGAMYIYNDPAAIESCTFSGNSCSSTTDAFGGAVFMNTSENSQSSVKNSTFSANKSYTSSSSYGGALYAYGTISLICNTFTNGNEAADRGGAIYVGNGTLIMTANIVVGNNAQVGNDICNEAQITTNGYNRIGVYGTGNSSSAQNALWSLTFNNDTDRESDTWTTETFFGQNADLAINATGNANEPPAVGCTITSDDTMWLLTIKLSEDINLPMNDRATNIIPYNRRTNLAIPRYDQQRTDRFASGSAITIGACYSYKDWGDDQSSQDSYYPIDTITMSGITNLKYPGQNASLIAMILYTNGRTAFGIPYDQTSYTKNSEEPVRWSSSMPNALKVDKNGNITALGDTGSNGATITVTTVRPKTSGTYASASQVIVINADDFSDTYNYLNVSPEYRRYLYSYLNDLYKFDYDLSIYPADVNSSAITASSFQNNFAANWNAKASQVTDLTTSGPTFTTATSYNGTDSLVSLKKGAVSINFQNRTLGDIFPVVYTWNLSGTEVKAILGREISSATDMKSNKFTSKFADALFTELRITYQTATTSHAVIGGNGVKASEAQSSGALVLTPADGNKGVHIELTAYLANVSGNETQLVRSSGSNELLVVPDGANDGAITGTMWLLQVSSTQTDPSTPSNSTGKSSGGGGCEVMSIGIYAGIALLLLKRK